MSTHLTPWGLEPLLSVTDLAEYLGVPVPTVYEWRGNGTGPVGYRIGKHLKFAVSDVRAWVDEQNSTGNGIVLLMSFRDQLWDVAVDQYGYVSTTDAARLGVPPAELPKLSHRGTLDRVSQGVYRFPEWPISANDHLMEAVLWTRDPTAVLSHDTALDVLDLCDINPTTLHLTVSDRRYPIRRRDTPDDLVIHYEHLDDTQRGWWEQIPTVTAQTAIEQGIRAAIRPDLLRQAIDTARRRSMVDGATADRLRDTLERKYR